MDITLPGRCYLNIIKVSWRQITFFHLGPFPSVLRLIEYYIVKPDHFISLKVDCAVQGNVIHIRGPGSIDLTRFPATHIIGAELLTLEALTMIAHTRNWSFNRGTWEDLRDFTGTVYHQDIAKVSFLYISTRPFTSKVSSLEDLQVKYPSHRLMILPRSIGNFDVEYAIKYGAHVEITVTELMNHMKELNLLERPMTIKSYEKTILLEHPALAGKLNLGILEKWKSSGYNVRLSETIRRNLASAVFMCAHPRLGDDPYLALTYTGIYYSFNEMAINTLLMQLQESFKPIPLGFYTPEEYKDATMPEEMVSELLSKVTACRSSPNFRDTPRGGTLQVDYDCNLKTGPISEKIAEKQPLNQVPKPKITKIVIQKKKAPMSPSKSVALVKPKLTKIKIAGIKSKKPKDITSSESESDNKNSQNSVSDSDSSEDGSRKKGKKKNKKTSKGKKSSKSKDVNSETDSENSEVSTKTSKDGKSAAERKANKLKVLEKISSLQSSMPEIEIMSHPQEKYAASKIFIKKPNFKPLVKPKITLEDPPDMTSSLSNIMSTNPFDTPGPSKLPENSLGSNRMNWFSENEKAYGPKAPPIPTATLLANKTQYKFSKTGKNADFKVSTTMEGDKEKIAGLIRKEDYDEAVRIASTAYIRTNDPYYLGVVAYVHFSKNEHDEVIKTVKKLEEIHGSPNQPTGFDITSMYVMMAKSFILKKKEEEAADYVIKIINSKDKENIKNIKAFIKSSATKAYYKRFWRD